LGAVLSAGLAGSLCRKARELPPSPFDLAAGWQRAATLLLPEQEGVRGIRFPVWLNKEGKRVAADCPDAREGRGRLAAAAGTLAPGSRAAGGRIPAASAVCPPLAQDRRTAMLSGVREGASSSVCRVKRVSLPLQASGSSGERWWFLNGEPLDVKGRVYTLQLDKSGDYQLLVMDDAGQVTTVNFTLQ
jgi:penicillin-binding protein 1C